MFKIDILQQFWQALYSKGDKFQCTENLGKFQYIPSDKNIITEIDNLCIYLFAFWSLYFGCCVFGCYISVTVFQS